MSAQAMTSEQKEKALDLKMQGLRIKNEKLKKRHEEIEADKKSAPGASSAIIFNDVKSYTMKNRAVRERIPRPAVDHNKANSQPMETAYGKENGAPPDPSYRFLADPRKEPEKRCSNNVVGVKERAQNNQPRVTNWPRNPHFIKQRAEQERKTLEAQQWKANTDQYAKERTDRCRDNNGQWQREWDSHKEPLMDKDNVKQPNNDRLYTPKIEAVDKTSQQLDSHVRRLTDNITRSTWTTHKTMSHTNNNYKTNFKPLHNNGNYVKPRPRNQEFNTFKEVVCKMPWKPVQTDIPKFIISDEKRAEMTRVWKESIEANKAWRAGDDKAFEKLKKS